MIARLVTLLLLLAVSCNGPAVYQSNDHGNSRQVAKILDDWRRNSPTEFSFAVMGDNRDGDLVFKRILHEIETLNPKPLFTVDNGDLVPSGLDSQYKHFLNMIAPCRIPFIVTPGNHDYENGGDVYYRKYFGSPYYSFDLGRWRFIFLDNASGDFGSEQLAWLEKLLADKRPSFLFMHMPPKIEDWWHGCKADPFAKLVSNKNVQAVFCGHIHAFGDRIYNGVRYIISGGAGAPLHNFFKHTQAFHHYLAVTVKSSGEWSFVVKKVDTVKNVAAIVTVYHHNSHADVLVGRLLQTDRLDGKGTKSSLRLVSLYTDQTLKDRPDLSQKLSEKYGFKLCKTIEEALTLGTGKLAVDGVLLICEGGNYPISKTGQIEYPKRKYFEKIIEIFKESKRIVPVFVDKNLSDTWEDSKWLYDTAAQMKIPIMAGSCLPVVWRYPPIDLKRGSRLQEVVAISYHTLDGYGFHALEMVQSLIERREGGEHGIRRVQCLEGKAVWEAEKKGIYSRQLLEDALKRQKWSSKAHENLEQQVANPVLFHLEYVDGLKVSILTLNNQAREWALAWRHKDGKEESTLFWTQEARPFMHFTYQLLGIEELIHTGKSAWPAERTLLTSGALYELLKSKTGGGKTIDTPHLNTFYEAKWEWSQPPPPPKDRPIEGE